MFLNIAPSFTAAQLGSIRGRQYLAPDMNVAKGLFVVPLDDDSYIGFYNKKVFKKAGIAAAPMNWLQLQSDCTKLKAIGVTPMMYGLPGGQTLGAEFYPWFDFSYLMIGLYTPAQWRNLYMGKTSWTSPAIVSQMTKWAALKQSGCTNSDVLTASNTLGSLIKGKTAMIVDGTFDTGTLLAGLGKNLGTFAPPYANGKIHGVVQYPGDGYGVTAWTAHQAEAVQFEQFLTTPQAAAIIAAAGVPPNRAGFAGKNPSWATIQKLVDKQKFTVYPMIDNVVQPEVVDTGSKQLVAAFAGVISVKKALGDMKATLDGLPVTRKGPTYSGG
jgi:ABC-type glycerol-3-phosphate transport system substrate-binding protein